MRPLEFGEKLLAQISPVFLPASKIRWVSPLASENFTEYRDERFLGVLGLERYSGELQEFWPKGGPCWDALGTLESPSGLGVVLVEAKSHGSELVGELKAKDPESLRKIGEALAETKKRRCGPNPDSYDWTRPYYQAANRLVFLHFLRSRKVEAWLANVYFLNDPHFRDSPHSPDEWGPIIDNMKQALGLVGRDMPYTVNLFLEASDGY
jgi:hypothetical protein